MDTLSILLSILRQSCNFIYSQTTYVSRWPFMFVFFSSDPSFFILPTILYYKCITPECLHFFAEIKKTTSTYYRWLIIDGWCLSCVSVITGRVKRAVLSLVWWCAAAGPATFSRQIDAIHSANRRKRAPAEFLTTVECHRDGTPLSGDP